MKRIIHQYDNNIITEYQQKKINPPDDKTNQPSTFRTKTWVEINDDSKGKFDNSDIRFKTSMIRSNL